jgi:hypothetical protein
MIGRRMANVIKRFARHRDDMRLENFQRVRGRQPFEATSANPGAVRPLPAGTAAPLNPTR